MLIFVTEHQNTRCVYASRCSISQSTATNFVFSEPSLTSLCCFGPETSFRTVNLFLCESHRFGSCSCRLLRLARLGVTSLAIKAASVLVSGTLTVEFNDILTAHSPSIRHASPSDQPGLLQPDQLGHRLQLVNASRRGGALKSQFVTNHCNHVAARNNDSGCWLRH